jgi:hypothetical protein
LQNLFKINSFNTPPPKKKIVKCCWFTKDKEDEEAEEEDIAEHGERIQEQHHQDPHTLNHNPDQRSCYKTVNFATVASQNGFVLKSFPFSKKTHKIIRKMGKKY